MKKVKKTHPVLPEVHILGDAEDVQNLVKGLNKKNVIVVFKNADHGTLHLEMKGKIEQILPDDVVMLEKEFRIVYFSFFPGQKQVVPVAEAVVEIPTPSKPDGKKQKAEKEKKGGKVKKEKKSGSPKKEEHKKKKVKK